MSIFNSITENLKKIEETRVNDKDYCCFVDHTFLVITFRVKDWKLSNILNRILCKQYYGNLLNFLSYRNINLI